MSEKHHFKSHEQHVFSYERPSELNKELQQLNENEETDKSFKHEDIEQIRLKISEHTKDKTEVLNKNTERHNETVHHHYITKKIKQNAYYQTLKHTRNKLSKRDKQFSKLVHQHTVESVSNATANTVANPSGILGGGIVSFLGSITVLYLSRKIGFEVPASLFIILFITGFVVGFITEKLFRNFITKEKSINKLNSF